MTRKKSVRTGRCRSEEERRGGSQEPIATPEDLESVSPPENPHGGAKELPPFDPSQAVPAEDLSYGEREGRSTDKGRGRRRGRTP